LAQSSLRETFEAEEKAERELKEHRKKTERVYVIDPAFPPVLFDEGRWQNETRPSQEFAAAEQRLRDFGFAIETDQNVTTCKLLHEGRLVLADPRFAGKIEFYVFANPKGTRRTRFGARYEHFSFRDEWKRDALARFKHHLDQAVSRLPPLAKVRNQ
jgi:hypothetical protein